ncbi:hypothetical protein, partial [Pelotomaculum sp. PtaB.Bin117]|uniref:hypothetical protein n=1 Tax=Pelotomaculum sp. PtaB.Bin117 TaxID=1811694 RepID=UPI00257E144F
APFEQTLNAIQHVEENSNASEKDTIIFIYSDSYTRKNKYAMAQKGIERSIQEGTTMLNGYPVVSYGVKYARKIYESMKSPIMLNTADEDSRLQLEIVLASGWSGYSSRSLQEVIAHCKNIPLDEMIRHGQYEDRLAAYYTEVSTPVLSFMASNLTGYDIAAFHVITVVTHILLAAEQGVKHIMMEHGLGMNLVQDVAMLKVCEKLTKYYLDKFGYKDITLTTSIFPYLGSWPLDVDKSTALIAWNTIIGILGGANSIFLKCADEAYGTPTKEGMASAAKLARHLIRVLRNQTLPDNKELDIEEQMIEAEARAVIEKLYEMGDGDLAVGMVKGVEAGVLDTMFAPWRWLKGNVLLVRDVRGALRYLKHGNVPLPKEVIEYNREKIAERERKDNITAELNTLIHDVGWASRL